MEMKFKNEKEYTKFLNSYLKKLGAKLDCNIFGHCVTAYTKYSLSVQKFKTELDERRYKMKGIIENGLDLDGSQGGHYGSINGTMAPLGNVKDVDVNKIANYSYYMAGNPVISMIFAIPKYLKLGGKKVEFSSYNGGFRGLCGGDSDNDKYCIYDVIKDSTCPKQFLLLCQIVDKETGEVTCLLNDDNFATGDPKGKEKLMQSLNKKYEESVKKFGTRDTKELICAASKWFDQNIATVDAYEP